MAITRAQIARQLLQEGGVSMVDPRMKLSLEENIARNEAARERNQGLRAASLLSQAERLRGPTTRLYSGTTSPTPFGGSKFFATPDLATAKTYATSGPLRGSPFAGPVTGRILQADVPTAQAQNLLKRGLTGTREVVLDPQAAKTLFETGRGALEGSASLGTRAALGATRALPVVGGAATLADASSRAREGDYVGAALGTAGAVPGLGLPALGTQIVYDVAKNNPIIQKVGTSIGEGVYDLLNPEVEAATPTFEPSTQNLIPGFTAKERPDGRLEYTAPDGQVYGPDTYADIAAGKYPKIYNPDKEKFRLGLFAAQEVDAATGDRLYDIDKMYADYLQAPGRGYFSNQEMYDRFKQYYADGGSVDLTIITMPDISGSGVESLFKRR